MYSQLLRRRVVSSVLCHSGQKRHYGNKAPRNILLLNERGLINDTFPREKSSELAAHLEARPRCVYAGFDPTADSLHVGNLLVIVALLHCQRAGHRVIALVGGGTAGIGDPSGRTSERSLIDKKTLEQNVLGLERDLRNIFANHAEHFYDGRNKRELGEFSVVNNQTWYDKLSVLDFFGVAGRHLRLGRMIKRESVRSRMESEEGISFQEFSYQAFQAYDWLRLLEEFQCTVQIGGSDQMGNITAGHDLISRAKDTPVYGITLPLVTSDKGEKLGKTAKTPVWLSAEKTSPYDFYQYFLRLPDSEVAKLLPLFSLLPFNEIADVMKKHESNTEKRMPHRKLAEQLTLLVHGKEGLDLAKTTTDILFSDDVAAALAKLSPAEMSTVFGQADYVRMLFSPGICILEFAMKIGCFRTEKDAIRIISAGGFYVNQTRVQNTEEVVVPGNHVLPNDTTLVRVGKKNFYVIEWTM